jgi:hypothetical protein
LRSKQPKKEFDHNAICKYCGSKFIKDSINQVYCSRICREKFYKSVVSKKTKDKRKEFTVKVCKGCGEPFNCPSTMYNKIYCNDSCRYKNRGDNNHKNREAMKAQIKFKVTLLIQQGNQPGESLNGQYINYYYIPFLESVKEEVMKRDNYECQICGSKIRLHVHHIISRINGGNHNTENLITLCSSCHRHIETKDINHAITGCIKNVFKETGNIKIRKNKVNRTELINKYFDKFQDTYEKLNKLSLPELQEILIDLDNFISENF